MLRMQAVASKVALYVMSHMVDMQNPVCWLERTVSGVVIPKDHGEANPVRLVLQPFHVKVKHQASRPDIEGTPLGQATPQSKQTQVRSVALRYALKSQRTASFWAGGLTTLFCCCLETAAVLSTQVSLRSVMADTTSYEYDVIVDVISRLLLAPGPEVAHLARHQPGSATDTDPAIVKLLDGLQQAQRQVIARQQHLCAMARCVSIS
jgi:hypothetical protein